MQITSLNTTNRYKCIEHTIQYKQSCHASNDIIKSVISLGLVIVLIKLYYLDGTQAVFHSTFQESDNYEQLIQ